MIVLTKITDGFAHLLVDGKKVTLMVGDLFTDDEKVIRTCRFCGREFDSADHYQTMCEQALQRDSNYFQMANAKYCGLYCSWLSQPGMHRVLGQMRIEEMKKDITERVLKSLSKKKKEGEKDVN